MYAFVLRGDDTERALERLRPSLDGRLGVVREPPAADGGETAAPSGAAFGPETGSGRPADTAYVLGDGWRASGDGVSLSDALDRLAPDHEYAAVCRVSGVELPTIAVGDGEADDAAVTAPSAAELDVGAAVDAIHEADPYETLESLVAAVKNSRRSEFAGAIATFTGRVRAKEGPDDERTRYLEFEKYDDVAERRMREIEADLEERAGVLDVRLHHRTGRIPDGEDIVFVVVLAGHRREAFQTVEDGIDRLKDEVPLFKKEVTDGESFWVHQRDDETPE
jgi:molybdopterin synthase catalytic subunit